MKYSRHKELCEDIHALFTLTRLDVMRGFDMTEEICMRLGSMTNYSDYAVEMAQVFWTTVFHNALDAYLEDHADDRRQ